MEAASDTLRWIAVDNSLAKSIWSGANQLAGYASSHCSRQPRGPAPAMRHPSSPVRWLLGSSGRTAVQLAGVSGAAAVALGAYGAHKLRAGDHNPELVQVFDTANRYHMLHSLALLGAPLCRRPGLVAALLSSGILVFSGTCYYYALTGDKSVRRFTPYGGMLLIAGWLAMAL
ncbi:transmembrane protein 256 homolog [Amphibalanus amphitrite]|uniref:transmembrane protein 256 homolog n=1 Tax=Amphibalanus amphitrite TaxID=1232801 RepID=UPI001C9055E0|nr:transmembrane protein 256 homolog [Amphibalanus amphitrite]XP_043190166.1 transmembrane protein 256 homolog [Amphibalanus amphitrite]XP_043190167.1 transmembrane protein 256 homolog [Amphibalanus amphitrite]XP_043190168.1 transmembrane protein 256 homolog [Amphibalanus amphitrite]XP_043190169.1 transmembrane protein 256 homolog [Amphibalanus amphitrite]